MTAPVTPPPTVVTTTPSNRGWLIPILAVFLILVLIGVFANPFDGSDKKGLTQADVDKAVKTAVAKANKATATTVPATPTTAATAAPAAAIVQPAPALVGEGSLPAVKSMFTQGAWKVDVLDASLNGEDFRVMDWLKRLRDPAPARWKSFPNVENKDVPEFPHIPCKDNPEKVCVPAGLEYGVPNVPFCYTSPCDLIVPAQHYSYYSGPYNFQGETCGIVGTDQGCILVVVNVMDKSVTFRNQRFDNGFRLPGRYFDGDKLEWGIWGLVSHGSANMLNMPTSAHPGESLNFGTGTNAGANCGTPQGCTSVDIRVLVFSGDRGLVRATTNATRP